MYFITKGIHKMNSEQLEKSYREQRFMLVTCVIAVVTLSMWEMLRDFLSSTKAHGSMMFPAGMFGFAGVVAYVSCMFLEYEKSRRQSLYPTSSSLLQSGKVRAVPVNNATGDVVGFIYDMVREYGGSPRVDRPTTEFRSMWGYAKDNDGFQVFVTTSQKEQLAGALASTFGAAHRSDSYPQLMYTKEQLGLYFFCDMESDPVHIICMRLSSMEECIAAMRTRSQSSTAIA